MSVLFTELHSTCRDLPDAVQVGISKLFLAFIYEVLDPLAM